MKKATFRFVKNTLGVKPKTNATIKFIKNPSRRISPKKLA